MFDARNVLLRKAYERFVPDDDFGEFTRSNGYWLEDYALYMAIKDSREGRSWTEWEEELRDRQPSAVQAIREELASEIQYYRFKQYKFYTQWDKLKRYANDKGIQIIGDMPIYVAFDSSDAWANPLLFQFDEHNQPVAVAGCPPDYFAPKDSSGVIRCIAGSITGKPDTAGGYRGCSTVCACTMWSASTISVDLTSTIRYPSETRLRNSGHWEKGPGLELFHALKEKVDNLSVIAEDLGFLTDSVLQLVKDTRIPRNEGAGVCI